MNPLLFYKLRNFFLCIRRMGKEDGIISTCTSYVTTARDQASNAVRRTG